jgi:LPXTG-motif cell wall-anchored protein
MSEGEYAGVVIGVLAGFMLIAGCAFLVVKRRSEESVSEHEHTAVSTSHV